MCGRFVFSAQREQVARQFAVELHGAMRARYNITPGTGILAVRENPHVGGREPAVLTWGLVPEWAEDPNALSYKMINARAGSAADKPAYRNAMRRRRCLVPADGFYEWRRSGGGPKQPYYFRAKGGQELLALAGLWEHWDSPDGSEIESCALLTTAANGLMEPIHDRMPVIIPPGEYDRWLDTRNEKPGKLEDLLGPPPEDALERWPVSNAVNNPRNDAPEMLTPVAEERGEAQGELF